MPDKPGYVMKRIGPAIDRGQGISFQRSILLRTGIFPIAMRTEMVSTRLALKLIAKAHM